MENRPMEKPERQMPAHVGAAYKDAVDNIIFLKRQQWVATNYALLVYAVIFVISAEYFSRTGFCTKFARYNCHRCLCNSLLRNLRISARD
jgi:hypothetical protein